jgi:hypothetical protein
VTVRLAVRVGTGADFAVICVVRLTVLVVVSAVAAASGVSETVAVGSAATGGASTVGAGVGVATGAGSVGTGCASCARTGVEQSARAAAIAGRALARA